MNDRIPKWRLALYAIFVLLSLLIITDFIFPGRVIYDEIIELQRVQQRHYNASRNYHYSYKVITSEHQFSISEDFAQLAQEQENIEYSVSRIFKEVNWYRLLPSENKSFYSLRIALGLALPLLSIISIAVALRSKMNIDTFLAVLQAVLIADLIYLMT